MNRALFLSRMAMMIMAALLAAPAFSQEPVPTQEPPEKTQSIRERNLDKDRHEKALALALRRLESLERLGAADHTALKRAAAERVMTQLKVCGDPGNMPLSNIHGEGFQNKIIELVAESMGTTVKYFWRPYLERGMTRQTFDTRDCDILLDIPYGYERILTTNPVYRTTYVLAFRTDRNMTIANLDDPQLKELKIGVFQTSAMRQALKKRGITNNVSLHVLSHDADLKPEHQPWFQVQQVVDGKLDIAGVWGPFGGWMKAKGAPITLAPVNLWEDDYPMEFDLAVGLRNSDQILRYKIELVMEEKKAEIEKILRDFGVPLVQCSRCVVQGDLTSHGAYEKIVVAKEPTERQQSPDQKVTRERLEAWLAEGADVQQELANAVLAGDPDRVSFLIEKGADINKLDSQGYTALHSAARHRKTAMVKLLLSLKADPNARDSDGMTAVMHAVLRNDGASIKVLAAHGADLDAKTTGNLTPLALAIIENRYIAAMALIESGATPDAPSGDAALTPLMLAAGQRPIEMSLGAGKRIIEKLNPLDPGPLEVINALIERKANVNVVSATGLTALHLAAGHDSTPIVGLLVQSGANVKAKTRDGKTASEIAKDNGNTAVVSVLRLLEEAGNN